MFGAILGGLAALGACSYISDKREKRKTKEFMKNYSSYRAPRTETYYATTRQSNGISYNQSKRSNNNNRNASNNHNPSKSNVKVDRYEKKVEFYDLYREIDNYLGDLIGKHDGGGITATLCGARKGNIYYSDSDTWYLVKAYRNKLSHDRAKWKNVPDPNPEFIRFLRRVYGDVKSNPGKYIRMMKADKKQPKKSNNSYNNGYSHQTNGSNKKRSAKNYNSQNKRNNSSSYNSNKNKPISKNHKPTNKSYGEYYRIGGRSYC